VLVVEDDVGVLALNTETLEGLGYTVTTATDARSALAVLETGEPFDLLFSDVVMPGGMSGVDLAREVRKIRPGIAILLASGFVADADVLTQSEFPLIEKPYERAALAAKLRDVLTRTRKPSRAPRARSSSKLSAEAAP
jgi:CheY-like chemotaxis protein